MTNDLEAPQMYLAFAGSRLLVESSLQNLLPQVKQALDKDQDETILIFDESSGKQVDFNFQGSLEEVLARALPRKPKNGPGRPRLGVTCREISLLPRHWEWLDQQPQGASAALRRLVEEARKREPNKAQARRIREAAGKVMWGLAGNGENFEEASRALYAGDTKGFKRLVHAWPKDVREYLVRRLQMAEKIEAGAS